MEPALIESPSRWTLREALRVTRPPGVGFVAVCTLVLAVMVGVIAGLEDSESVLAAWSRVVRWVAANLGATAVIIGALWTLRRVVPARLFVQAPRWRALAVCYGSYFASGVAGGFTRFVLMLVTDVPPADPTLTHHLARGAAIAFGMLLLAALANQYRWFLDRIHAQQQALRD